MVCAWSECGGLGGDAGPSLWRAAGRLAAASVESTALQAAPVRSSRGRVNSARKKFLLALRNLRTVPLHS